MFINGFSSQLPIQQGVYSGLSSIGTGFQPNIATGISAGMPSALSFSTDISGFSPDIRDRFSSSPLASILGNGSSFSSVGINTGLGMIPGFGGSCTPLGSLFGGLVQQNQMMQMMMLMMMQMMMNKMGGFQSQAASQPSQFGAAGAPGLGGVPGAVGGGAVPGIGGGSGGGGAAPSGGANAANGSNASQPYNPEVQSGNFTEAGRPNGLSQIKAMFGEPGQHQVTVEMPCGKGGAMQKVTCHEKIAPRMKAAFEEVKRLGLSNLIKTFDGCFCNRAKRGGSEKSVHSWGIAFDLNAAENPMRKGQQPTADQAKLAAVFKKFGFYNLPGDPMHFQFATGY